MKSAIALNAFAVSLLLWELTLGGDKALMRRHQEVAIEQDTESPFALFELQSSAAASASVSEDLEFVEFDATVYSSPEALYDAYARWHQEQLVKQDCCKKRAVVETPGSGLGDSVGAITSAFRYALVTGRLFFLNWEYDYSWRLGLGDPGFAWDWVDAVRSGKMCVPSAEQQRCHGGGDRLDKAIAFINGTIAGEHWLHTLSLSYPDLRFPGDWYGSRLIRPSTTVSAFIEPTLQQFAGQYIVGIAVRTGAADGQETIIQDDEAFLSPGDENRFLQCFNAIASEHATDGTSVKAFVTSDSAVIAVNLCSAIGKDSCLSIAGPVAHTAHPDGAPFSDDGLRKAYADFFILQHSQVAILTQDSLFGASAVQLANIEYGMIEDSKCGQGMRHSCAADGFPPAVCPHAGDFPLDALPPSERSWRPQESVLFCFSFLLVSGVMATLVVCGNVLPSELILAKLASRRWRNEEVDPRLFNFERNRFAGH